VDLQACLSQLLEKSQALRSPPLWLSPYPEFPQTYCTQQGTSLLGLEQTQNQHLLFEAFQNLGLSFLDSGQSPRVVQIVLGE
jgi:hypothetical protein